MLQGSFRCLHVPLPISSVNRRCCHIETCVRLSNVRTNCVGINEIHSVYMPIWRASEVKQLWLELGDMVFGDIQKCDRISRFHLEVVG